MRHVIHSAGGSAVLTAVLLVGGCQTTTVHTTRVDPIIRPVVELPESQLLNVGVDIFDPGFSAMVEEGDTFDPALRDAEARFMPVVLVDALQRSGNWGVVRVIPNRQSEMEVWVEGSIVHSDGERLELEITVEDVARNRWYTKTYAGTSSKFSYDPVILRQQDPFQSIFNQIANDMYAYARELSVDDRKTLQHVSELKFARRFARERFGDYLEQDSRGVERIVRLPAENDPFMDRIRRIRERDYVFTDTLQDYYVGYQRQIEVPYNGWRQETYEQVIDLREEKRQANAELIGGAVALLGGIAMGIAGGSTPVQMAGIAAAISGVPLITDGLTRKARAQTYVGNIQELTDSFNLETAPYTVELEDRIITLSGTVDEAYAQWRELLQQFYEQEMNLPPASAAAFGRPNGAAMAANHYGVAKLDEHDAD